MITLQDVRNNPDITALVDQANLALGALGYTEHGPRHVGYVSRAASKILQDLGYPERTVELAAITGWVHDVGNAVNRFDHGLTGAALILPLLKDMGMPMGEIAQIMTAVGNHEEQTGYPVTEIAAALIIADKSDAHRTRVRRKNINPADIHDRVNYSIKKNWITVDAQSKVISYEMIMDETSSVMDFMTIYLSRMTLCEQSAKTLGCSFRIIINGVLVNNSTLETGTPTYVPRL